MDDDIAGSARRPVNDLQTVVPTLALSIVDWVAIALLLVGALNWGLVGLAGYDIIAAIAGPASSASRIVYGVFGLAGLYGIYRIIRLATRRHA